MTEFTKGPWVEEGETLYGTDFGFTVPLMDLSYYAENERYIFDTFLIAAAPDLYEALEKAIDDYDIGERTEYPDWMVTARAALSKARGETNA